MPKRGGRKKKGKSRGGRVGGLSTSASSASSALAAAADGSKGWGDKGGGADELRKICTSKDPPDMVKVRELIGRGGDLHDKDHGGATALYWALCHFTSSPGHIDVVKALVESDPGLVTEHCREVDSTGRGLMSYASNCKVYSSGYYSTTREGRTLLIPARPVLHA